MRLKQQAAEKKCNGHKTCGPHFSKNLYQAFVKEINIYKITFEMCVKKILGARFQTSAAV
jgi:hypothetical protein